MLLQLGSILDLGWRGFTSLILVVRFVAAMVRGGVFAHSSTFITLPVRPDNPITDINRAVLASYLRFHGRPSNDRLAVTTNESWTKKLETQ